MPCTLAALEGGTPSGEGHKVGYGMQIKAVTT